MPSVSISNFENDELISSRLLSFMNNHESSLTHSEVTGNGNKFTSSPNFGAPLTDLDVTHGSNLRSPLHRNGSTHSMATLQERVPNGSPNECNTNSLLVSASSPGLISGSCTPPPPTSVLPSASVSGNFLPVRGHGYTGAPPYSALTSPCLGSKAVGNAGMNHMLSYNGTSSGHGECHSLQNSPFYNHNPMNTGLQRQFGGISPASVSGMLPNGVNHLTLGSRGGGLYTPENTAYTLNNMRPLNASVCPQRELFPASPMSNQTGANGQSIFGAGLLMQERLRWYELAQKHGFIVGPELERVKENSCRSTSQSYGRIAAHFRNRYGETEAKTKAAYLQIGVRVPSKDHVSEIVGKGGQKIKLIREETGALITTPGEHEEHVFIIEAPPEIAMRVAQHLTTRAQEITQSKLSAGERRRGSTSSQVNGLDPSGNACGLLTTTNGNCYNTNGGGNGSGCVVGSAHSNSCGGGGGGLLAPNGVCLGSNATGNGGPSSLLSLSVTNSPLHPSAAGGGSSLISTSANGGSTRVACSGLFSSHLSSLPNSPCSGSNGGSNGFPGHGQSSLFLSNGNGMMLGPGGTGANGGSSMLNSSSSTQSGSRVLLARSRISVPQEMVGKIIGTQGSIITTIQKDTGTEIKSPPKEAARGPNATSEFEISAYQGLGLSSNQAAECRVQQAKQLIGHLVMRQLERRASEEIEDNSGCANLNLNSDDSQRFGTASGTPRSVGSVGNGNGSNSGSSNGIPGWMWPDVAQMDSQEAREVLDRILAESKNKTRRAKELAAAAAAASPGSACTGGGPSPTSNGTISALNMVGCMSAQNSGYGNSSSDQSHSSSSGPSLSSPHQRFHAPSQLLVPSVSNFMDPSGSGEASDYHGSDTVGIFNPHSNSHYGSRGGCLNSLNLLGDDMSQLTNCNTSGNHMCSPRGLHGFNMGDPNDLSSSSSGLSRAPGTNLGAELWNPLSVFNGSDNSVMPPSMQPFLGSGSHVNSLFTTSAPPPNAALPHHLSTTTNPGCDGLNGLGASKTALSTDFHDCTNNSSMFNFTDALGTQFASANGDLSPTLLMHLRAQQQQQPRGDLSRQPLTRRHSDWVVNPNQLMSSDQSSMMRPHTATNIATSRHVTLSEHRLQQFALSGRSDSDNVGSPSSTTDTSVTTGPVHFGPGSPHLDLIKALDQLCLHSNVDPVSTCSGSSPNGSSSLPHCPPGFEHQPGLSSQSLSSSPQQQQSHQTPVSTTDSLYSACSVKPTDPDCFVPSTASVNNNDTHHPTDVWSTNVCDTTGSNTQFILNAQAVCTTTTSSLSAMHALSPTDYLGPSGFGKNSLLRRLFPSPNIGLEHISAVGEEEEVAAAAAAKTARLNAIWSQTVHDPINSRASSLGSGIVCRDAVDDDGDDDDLVTAFPYLSAHGSSDVGQTASHVSSYMPYPGLGITTGSESTTEHPVTITRCCGAIGDGRRRRCPSTSTSSPTRVVDQMSGVSVTSSAIASITEVA